MFVNEISPGCGSTLRSLFVCCPLQLPLVPLQNTWPVWLDLERKGKGEVKKCKNIKGAQGRRELSLILAFSRAFIPDVPSLSKSSCYTGTGTEDLKLTFKCYLNLRRIQHSQISLCRLARLALSPVSPQPPQGFRVSFLDLLQLPTILKPGISYPKLHRWDKRKRVRK